MIVLPVAKVLRPCVILIGLMPTSYSATSSHPPDTILLLYLRHHHYHHIATTIATTFSFSPSPFLALFLNSAIAVVEESPSGSFLQDVRARSFPRVPTLATMQCWGYCEQYRARLSLRSFFSFYRTQLGFNETFCRN